MHARRRTSEAIRRDSHNFLQERQPKSWPRPATHSSRCWHKISRCHQSSVDAGYVKDEVDRRPTVWSITSCSCDVTDNTCTRGYNKWAFSARQVRNELMFFFFFILFDFPKTYAGGGRVTNLLFFYFIISRTCTACLHFHCSVCWWYISNTRVLVWHCANNMNSYRQYTLTNLACEARMHTRLIPPPPSPRTHAHPCTQTGEVFRLQSLLFDFQLYKMRSAWRLKMNVQKSEFSTWNTRMPCVLKVMNCVKGNDLLTIKLLVLNAFDLCRNKSDQTALQRHCLACGI